jgi:hypothetical protein
MNKWKSDQRIPWDPCGPSKREFLARKHITAPPQFFPADIAHKDHDGVVNQNPPSPVQSNAHEILRTETIEKLMVEPRGIEESYGLQSWSKDACTPLEDRTYQNRSDRVHQEPRAAARWGHC